MSASTGIERLLQRERAVTLAALVALWALTWAWLFAGAGMAGATPASMPAMPDMPGMAMGEPAAAPGPLQWALMLAMWWTMMVAMMTPSAAPAVLLHARVHRHAQAQGRLPAGAVPTAAFIAGYFLAWLGFSLLATALQLMLQRSGLQSASTMALEPKWLVAAVLLFTGAYQLSPWKNACLSQCRSPAEFLSRHWRPGAGGALRLGLWHGAWCVGCCWLLMVLLFVGGVMNLAWIAALSLLVIAEKLLPGGQWLGRLAGIALLAWGAAIALQPA